MFTKEYSEDLKITQEIIDKYEMMDIAYFDIETTGFDQDKDKVVLISLGYFNEDCSFSVKQFFSESLEEEKHILVKFKNEIRTFKTWCSYNGIAFDEPFLNRRMKFNRINFDSPNVHIDLYKKVKPYQKQLGMERCNLKSVERFIGIERKDKIDGSISVELYEEYLTTKEEKLRDIIMLHNYEDVLNLPKIYKFISGVENDNFIIREDCITKKQFKFLKSLIKKHKVEENWNYEKLSKKTASKLIDSLLKEKIDIEELNIIIKNNY